MTGQQKRALREPCYLAIETIKPRFARKFPVHSVVLSLNSGYE